MLTMRVINAGGKGTGLVSVRTLRVQTSSVAVGVLDRVTPINAIDAEGRAIGPEIAQIRMRAFGVGLSAVAVANLGI